MISRKPDSHNPSDRIFLAESELTGVIALASSELSQRAFLEEIPGILGTDRELINSLLGETDSGQALHRNLVRR